MWRATLDGDATAMAAVAGHVFVATSGRWLYDLDAGRGRVRWRFRIQGAAIGLAVDEDRVVAVTLDQTVRAFKIGSGAQAWRQELVVPAGRRAGDHGRQRPGHRLRAVGARDRSENGRQPGPLHRCRCRPTPGGITLETLSAGPVLAERATLFDDMLVLVTQHGARARRAARLRSAGLARHGAAGHSRGGPGAAAGDARGARSGGAGRGAAPAPTSGTHAPRPLRRHAAGRR